MKMVNKRIGPGYMKVTFYSNQEWQELQEFMRMQDPSLLEHTEVLEVKDMREGFITHWRNPSQKFYSDTSPNTFIIEE
jgi:hypothetical protein